MLLVFCDNIYLVVRRISFSRLFVLIFLVAGLAASLALVRQKTLSRLKAAGPSTSNWMDMVLNWPVADPDSIDFYRQPDGNLAQILIKGDHWYYRGNTQNTNWSSGITFSETNKTTYPFPADKKMDSFTQFYWGTTLWQTVTKNAVWWSHPVGQPWPYAGTLFAGEKINGTSCKTALPSPPIDTMAAFPWEGKVGTTFTKGPNFWFKPDSTNPNSKTYTYCGRAVPGYEGSFSGHAQFQIPDSNGTVQMAELYTSGNKYWFFPNVNDRNTFTNGYINQRYPESESSRITLSPNSPQETISPNIFGANLIWHSPFRPDFTKITGLITNLGISHLRYPGGCGGDSFDGNTTDLNAFITLLKNTNTAALYTFNLEGSSHQNLNCHNLMDYPGTKEQAYTIASYFQSQGKPLSIAELGNEPWAGDSTYRNWYETWNATEYANIVKLFNLTPSIPLIAATGGKTDWEQAVSAAADSKINYYQLHPYTFGNPTKDFPLIQAGITAGLIRDLRSRGRQPAITEYNLYCWDGVLKKDGTQAYSINKSAGGLGQAIYLAQHLLLFAQENIQYASYWHLFEGVNSTWKCGLVKESPANTYSLTPAGKAFQLLSFLKKRVKIPHSYTGNLLTPLSVKNGSQISSVIINPSSASVKVTYYPQVEISSYRAYTLKSASPCTNQPDRTDKPDLLWSCLSGDIQINTINPSRSGNSLSVTLDPFSVTTIHINW